MSSRSCLAIRLTSHSVRKMEPGVSKSSSGEANWHVRSLLDILSGNTSYSGSDTHFGDFASIHYQNLVVIRNGLQPVRDRQQLPVSTSSASQHNSRRAGSQSTYGHVRKFSRDDPLDQCICLGIDTARSFVQYQDLASSHQSSNQRYYPSAILTCIPRLAGTLHSHSCFSPAEKFAPSGET